MLRKILNNSVEGFQRGYWKKEIVFNLSEEGLVSIRDYGTGIPQKYVERLVSGRPEYGRFCPGIFDEPESEVLCYLMERKQLLHPAQFTLFKR